MYSLRFLNVIAHKQKAMYINVLYINKNKPTLEKYMRVFGNSRPICIDYERCYANWWIKGDYNLVYKRKLPSKHS